jgi:threonylcarbamoyladenosine tRNA methylthiotransferase MtaB
MTSFSIHNFGCRVNQAEAFAWAEEFQGRGLKLREGWDRSDYVLVNSCTLTGRADRDVKRFIRRVVRENPRARLVVTGCYAERARGEFEAMPGVWMVIGNADKNGLAARILETATAPETGADRAAGSEAGTARAWRARAFIKIQDGCDFRCAYCVIPAVRGKSVSVGGDEVLARVRALDGRGYREIVLAGIHLSSYGLDLEPRDSLGGLVRRIGETETGVRVRLSSLDPRFVDPAFIAAVAAGPRIAPHFHLSLQSGSKKTLRAMGRDSSPEAYIDLLGRLRAASPEAALGADIIVGFPGETDADYAETRGFVARSPLTYVHVFPFSPREGTRAAAMEQVDEPTRRARAADLRELSREKDFEFRKRFEGRELEAVVIRNAGRGAKVLTGNGIDVRMAGCPAPRRERVTVRIAEVAAAETRGEALSSHPDR